MACIILCVCICAASVGCLLSFFSICVCGGSILDRWWICTIEVEELCVALREEFRYSLVGRSVGRLVVVCVWGHSVSHGVCILFGQLDAELGGSRPLQN